MAKPDQTRACSHDEPVSVNVELNRPDIFPLEKLPCELFFGIVDYAPESVHDLRLVSIFSSK